MTEKNAYLAIRMAGEKYVVHPTSEQAYKISEAMGEQGVWYFRTSKAVVEFAQAGVLGVYNTFEEAYAAILSADPGTVLIYKPVQPPTQ